MKIIEMHFYQLKDGVWTETSYTSMNTIGQEEMLRQYSDVMTWKYVHKSPVYLPVKTSFDYATGYRTVVFRERFDIPGPVVFKRVFVIKP